MTLFIMDLWKHRNMGHRHLWIQLLGMPSGRTQYPPKLQFFVWKCVLGVLPTRTTLNVRIPNFSRSCPVYENSEESVCHLLLFCPLAARFGSVMNIPLHLVSSSNFCIILRKILRLSPALGRKTNFLWWRLWKSRNTVIFLNKQF
ncbi:hypothetical protein LINPERHAP2_LOCUS14458 [Linum perenne]